MERRLSANNAFQTLKSDTGELNSRAHTGGASAWCTKMRVRVRTLVYSLGQEAPLLVMRVLRTSAFLRLCVRCYLSSCRRASGASPPVEIQFQPPASFGSPYKYSNYISDIELELLARKKGQLNLGGS